MEWLGGDSGASPATRRRGASTEDFSDIFGSASPAKLLTDDSGGGDVTSGGPEQNSESTGAALASEAAELVPGAYAGEEVAKYK